MMHLDLARVIGPIAVRPEYQKQGIGTLLMDELIGSYPASLIFGIVEGAYLHHESGYSDLCLSNQASISFFIKRGARK